MRRLNGQARERDPLDELVEAQLGEDMSEAVRVLEWHLEDVKEDLEWHLEDVKEDPPEDIDCFAEAISRTLKDEEVPRELSRDDLERAFAKKAELINLRSSDPDTFEKTIAILRRNCQEEKARRVEQGRFYNQANADADFRFWTTVPTWTPEEATALSFGKEPRRVNPKTLGELDDDECAFRDLYLARLSEIRVRFRAPDDARPAQVDAASLLKWLDEVKIEYPTELRTNSNSTPTNTTEYNQSAQTNKYNTVLKMLFAVVNGKPIYSPDGHHEAVARIERALRNAELQVSVETIRRHWSAAVELVDPHGDPRFRKKRLNSP